MAVTSKQRMAIYFIRGQLGVFFHGNINYYPDVAKFLSKYLKEAERKWEEQKLLRNI